MARHQALVSFLGIVIAASAAVVACGGDDDDPAPAAPRTGGEGESCTRTADCARGLACFDNLCVESGGGGGQGNGGTGGTSAGKGGTTPAPVLGGEGESCTRRADCEGGLGCFNQRCAVTSGAGGEGGGGTTPPLGERGETCALSSDCAAGLACRPGGSGQPNVGFVGVCTPDDSGITPTGKVCGAECVMAEDCCQLPLGLQLDLGGAKSCSDVAARLVGVDCSAPGVAPEPALCFAQDAYCDCADDTWACTAGLCFYDAACTTNGLVPGGCATQSRAGRTLVATCDAADTDRCVVPAGQPLCTADADCESMVVADDSSDVCVADECTCYSGACYRRCDEDLDCAPGRVCDTGDAVCVPADGCSSDVTCAARLGDFRAACVGGTCTLPCQADIDCNVDLVNGAFTRVCNAGMCQLIGCDSHDECTTGAVRLFCTEPEAATGARSATSAITD